MIDRLSEYRAALLEALRAGDSGAARALVGRMQTAGIAASDIYLQILAPAMVAIGELWERNELTVAEEHLATAITERLIASLSPSFEPAGTCGALGTALIGCVAGERHMLGARMLADLLRLRGWRVLDLGADVPGADWVKLAARFHADLAAISVNMPGNLASARELVAQLRAANPSILVLVGGAVFNQQPDLWRDLAANFYHPDPLTAVALVSAEVGRQLAARRGANAGA
jgi:methanogenic corrinoid protein MtbC1